MPDDPTQTQPNQKGIVVPVQNSSEVTVEITDPPWSPGRIIAGRRNGELAAYAYENDDGTWHLSVAQYEPQPPLQAVSEADALARVTYLTRASTAAVEAPVVAVTGDDLRRMLNLFREIGSRPYVPPVVRVWIDPIDRAVKIQAGSGMWSPPFGEIEATA